MRLKSFIPILIIILSLMTACQFKTKTVYAAPLLVQGSYRGSAISGSTVTLDWISAVFIFMIILFFVNIFLMLVKIPLFGIICALLTILVSAVEITDTTLPIYPYFNLIIIVTAVITIYINATYLKGK